MRNSLIIAVAALDCELGDQSADRPHGLVDANGFLDVQKLTCAQLAGTWQQDADALMTWYSGWYNGLAKKRFFHVSRARRLEHEVIVYCKANLGIRIIDAMAVIFQDERIRQGIQMRAD